MKRGRGRGRDGEREREREREICNWRENAQIVWAYKIIIKEDNIQNEVNEDDEGKKKTWKPQIGGKF